MSISKDIKKPSKVDAKLVKELTNKFEKLEKDFKTKKFLVELSETLVDFYTENFLPGIKWTGYECYAISELDKGFKSTFGRDKTSKLWSRDNIEATFHFIKTFEGTGSILFASDMKDFCDAFAKPMNEIQKNMQELKDVATELNAAEHGISVSQLISQSTTDGPK